MLFHKKDKENTALKEMAGRLLSVEQKLAGLEQKLLAGQADVQVLQQETQQFGKEIKKHNVAVENLLDDLEQKMEEEQTVKELRTEREKERENFLSLFEVYQEHFWQMKNFAKDRNEALYKQLAMMEKNMQNSQNFCGITVTGEEGEKVDYDMYEVVEAVETTDISKDKKVARIYGPGYLYQGKVKKRAKAAVYRFIS